MGPKRDVGQSVGSLAIIVGINVMISVIGYFVAFVFAYGFRDEIHLAEHVFFLVMIGVIAAVGAMASALIIKSAFHLSWSRAAALAISASAALHLLVVGLGSIISALNKDQGSVSAEFSTTTDVVVAATLLGTALLSGGLAWRALPRIASTVEPS